MQDPHLWYRTLSQKASSLSRLAAWVVGLPVLPALGAGHYLRLYYWGLALAICIGLSWFAMRHVPSFPRPLLYTNLSDGVVSSMLAQRADCRLSSNGHGG